MVMESSLFFENEYFKLNYFLKDEDYARELFANLRSEVEKILKFYDNFKLGKIEINLYHTIKEFRKDTSRYIPYDKQTDYMVGNVCGGKVNFVVPNVIKKVKKKVKNPNLYVKRGVIHEIVHIINKKINPKMLKWLNEGLATYLSEQQPPINHNQFNNHMIKILNEINYIPDINMLLNNTTFIVKEKHNGYTLSYIMVSYLIENNDHSLLMDMIIDDSQIKETILVDSVEFYRLTCNKVTN